MAHSTRQNIRAALRPLEGLAFAGLIVSCASVPPISKSYPLGNNGRPLADPGSVCVQIGPLAGPRENHGQCYQLVPPGSEHVEPLPLDEFGYLYPPLKPEPKSAPIAASEAAPVTVATPAVPPAATRAPMRAAHAPTPSPVFTTQVVEFRTPVPFAINSAHLTHANRTAITAFVNSLEHYRGVVEIVITGHTDASGSRRFNQWLSGMRAQSVRLHLLALGADPRHLRTESAGSNTPQPHAQSAAADRYVDIKVTVRVPEP